MKIGVDVYQNEHNSFFLAGECMKRHMELGR